MDKSGVFEIEREVVDLEDGIPDHHHFDHVFLFIDVTKLKLEQLIKTSKLVVDFDRGVAGGLLHADSPKIGYVLHLNSNKFDAVSYN